jgi:hypothetical protein
MPRSADESVDDDVDGLADGQGDVGAGADGR